MSKSKLQQEHEVQAIQRRLAQPKTHSYLRDAIYGAIDGTVTTFAVVTGAAGANLSPQVAVILGVANLLADGFSMGVGNYLSTRAETEQLDQARQIEESHIDKIPEGEREEIRQIYAAKGLQGDALEEVVRVITEDRQRWIATMLTEEWGLQLNPPLPLQAALTTFAAFLIAGCVPLIPFILLLTIGIQAPFLVSVIVTAMTFFAIGVLKGRIVERSLWRSGIETFLLGGSAAGLAYLVGWLLRGIGG